MVPTGSRKYMMPFVGLTVLVHGLVIIVRKLYRAFRFLGKTVAAEINQVLIKKSV